jgi:hypothetical protein
MAPLVRRSWAPAGQTPILRQRTRRHVKVSAIAALVVPPARTHIECYFRLHAGVNIDTARTVAFLRQLQAQLEGPLTIVWDRLQAHRAKAVRHFIRRHRWRNEFLPPYAPELNPVEYLWGYEKINPLANAPEFDLTGLLRRVRRATRAAQRDPALLRGLFHRSGLFLRLH